MPPRLKRILNTLSSQRLEACFYKSQGFFFFCFFNHKLLWFLRPAHKNLLCYCQQKYEEPHTRFFGMHVCFRARERSPSNGDGRESEHKKKPQNNPQKKTKQTKWGQNSNGRTATSETSQLIALGSALHGSARFCLINLSNLFLFFFVLSPPPTLRPLHTHSTLIILFLLLCLPSLPTSHFLKRARIYLSTGALLIYAGPSQGQSRADILSHSSVRAFPKGIY